MKFQKGEIAIIIRNSKFPDAPRWKGREVEILAVGPFPPGYSYKDDGFLAVPNDYIADLGGEWWGVDECDLRKRYPPGSDIARDIMAKLPKTEAA